MFPESALKSVKKPLKQRCSVLIISETSAGGDILQCIHYRAVKETLGGSVNILLGKNVPELGHRKSCSASPIFFRRGEEDVSEDS